MSQTTRDKRAREAQYAVDKRLRELRDEFWQSIDNDMDEQYMTEEAIYGN